MYLPLILDAWILITIAYNFTRFPEFYMGVFHHYDGKDYWNRWEEHTHEKCRKTILKHSSRTPVWFKFHPVMMFAQTSLVIFLIVRAALVITYCPPVVFIIDILADFCSIPARTRYITYTLGYAKGVDDTIERIEEKKRK